MKKAFVPLLLLLSLALRPVQPAGSQQAAFSFSHITIVDVVSGELLPDMTVVVAGGRISEVGKASMLATPEGTTVIDCAGKFLIPGLWDMHVHWYDQATLRLFTANGITGIREMFGNPELLKWRDAIVSGRMTGPRMEVASPIIDGPRPMWPNSIAVDNEAEGRKAVDKVKKGGADFVKVYSFLPRDAYFGIAAESKALGIPFVGHVPWSVSASEASDAGQKSIEHLTGVLLACSNKENEIRKQIPQTTPFNGRAIVEQKALESFDPRKADALFERFVKNGTWQCPTFTVLRSMAFKEEHDFRNDPRLKYMPSEVRDRWERRTEIRMGSQAASEYTYARRLYPKYFELVAAMRRAGVQFLAGTDTGNPYCFPGFSLHDELALLVQAGLSPIEALRTATLNPARFFGIEGSLGTIEKGKIADMVLLDANPLDDIKNTKKINAVVLDGRLFDRRALDKVLGR